MKVRLDALAVVAPLALAALCALERRPHPVRAAGLVVRLAVDGVADLGALAGDGVRLPVQVERGALAVRVAHLARHPRVAWVVGIQGPGCGEQFGLSRRLPGWMRATCGWLNGMFTSRQKSI